MGRVGWVGIEKGDAMTNNGLSRIAAAVGIVVVLAIFLNGADSCDCGGGDSPLPPPTDSPIIAPAPKTQRTFHDYFLPVVSVGSGNLRNPGFELGEKRDVLWWDETGRARTDAFQETRSPEGWTVFWIDDGLTGRPETFVFPKRIDPTAVREGDRSFKAFTTWRLHDMGLMQRVYVGDGQWSFLAWILVRFDDPRYPPPHHWANMHVRVGIDPLGRMDPKARGIVWTPWTESYGKWTQIRTPSACLAAGRVTVIVQSVSDAPFRNQALFIDGVKLIQE